jgi:hypothetical protein
MSSIKKRTTPSMMMTMIVTTTTTTTAITATATATAVRADLLGVARFQVAPPMTPWSLISVLERHLWRFTRYLLKRHMWRFRLTIHNNAPL